MNDGDFKFIKVRWRELMTGLTILTVSLMIPFVLNERTLHIYRDIRSAVDHNEFSFLMSAALKLIFMNCMRTTPLYLGAFLVCGAVTVPAWQKYPLQWFRGLLAIPIVMAAEYLTYLLTGVYYVFGFTAVIIVILIAILLQTNLFPDNYSGRVLVIILLTISLQFLTVNPATDFFRMGYGEISRDIKNVVTLMGYGRVMALVTQVLFILMALMTGIVIKLLQDEEKLRHAYRERTEMLIRQTDTHVRDVELRTYNELNSIIHDLKTPLAAIQGLSSLTAITSDNPKVVEYQEHIAGSG